MANRPLKEAENRLARFNRERDALVGEVVARVMERRLRAADKGGDASLEYVLNDACYHEIRRLGHGAATASEKKGLPAWRELATALGSMSDADKRVRLELLVRDYAGDVAGRFDERVYRFAKGILPAVLAGVVAPGRLTEGLAAVGDLAEKIVVDGPVDTLRACADRGTLVVAPTHASNMDSVVIGWAFDRVGLPPVTYGAGKNLFSNRFLSFFMHNLGAYRVDRRLRHEIYKDVLKEYSTVLLEHGYHSLFFPGGTRSRSGGVERRLKLGLLGTVAAAYQNHLAAGAPQKRLYVVPATINYAITLEAETLIDDFLAEEGKARYIIEDDEFSSLSRLYDFAKQVLGRRGYVHIRFGAPLDPLGNAVDERGESVDPRGRSVDPRGYFLGAGGALTVDAQRDGEYTKGLGDALTHAYRELSVLMPTHLVARALLDHVAHAQGTRDVYRLLRIQSELRVDHAELAADVARWRQRLAARPQDGVIAPFSQELDAGAVVEEALSAWAAYHQRPAAVRDGEDVVVKDLRLVLYYQNRTAHLSGRGGAAEAREPGQGGAR
jgi:glycerol-3-phosphate O-acyltransferase